MLKKEKEEKNILLFLKLQINKQEPKNSSKLNSNFDDKKINISQAAIST